jgi:hypothetical protein
MAPLHLRQVRRRPAHIGDQIIGQADIAGLELVMAVCADEYALREFSPQRL